MTTTTSRSRDTAKRPSLAEAARTNGNGKPAAPKVISDQVVPINQITPSQLNPRKHFDEAALADLAESIRQKGVLEPILLRPVSIQTFEGNGKGGLGKSRNYSFEIIAGERRFRAAKLAGLDKIPARIASYTDREALEVMVVENEQRADTTPMEKCRGYKQLIKDHGSSIEELAGRVGKSVSTIRGLLSIDNLPAEAEQALAEGVLPMSTAQLIARLPTEDLRFRMAVYVLAGERLWSPGQFRQGKPKMPKQFGQNRSGGGEEILSYRVAKEMIERCCLQELKAAPFNRHSLTLLPQAGSCEECPKRIGNLQKMDPEGWQGLRADVCTDPGCYRAKVEAHQENEIKEARAGGKEVLTGKQAAAVFDKYNKTSLPYNSPYQDLGGKCWEDRKSRTYEQIVGKELEDKIVLAVDAEGDLHRLAPKDAVKKALKAKGFEAQSSQSHGGSRPRESAAEIQKRKEKEALTAMCGRIALQQAGRAAGDAFDFGKLAPLLTILRCLCRQAVDGCYGDAETILEGRGVPAGLSGPAWEKRFEELLAKGNDVGLFALLVEASLNDVITGAYERTESKQLLEALGIDRKKIEAEAKKRLKQKCRQCGCTELDCKKCIEKTGKPCSWIEEDLCSACDKSTGELARAGAGAGAEATTTTVASACRGDGDLAAIFAEADLSDTCAAACRRHGLKTAKDLGKWLNIPFTPAPGELARFHKLTDLGISQKNANDMQRALSAAGWCEIELLNNGVVPDGYLEEVKPEAEASSPPAIYAWTIMLAKHGGDEEVFDLVAKTEKEATRKAMMKPLASKVISIEGMTEERYRQLHARRRSPL